MRIKRIGVIGAGIMGAGIAALAASTGVPVVLLDIPGSDDPRSPDRSGPAKKGLERALKAKPSAFFDSDRAALVTTGNTTDDLDLLAGCDWIIEVIIEKPAPKQELFARIEGIAPNAIVTSNTSGIPMSEMIRSRGCSVAILTPSIASAAINTSHPYVLSHKLNILSVSSESSITSTLKRRS